MIPYDIRIQAKLSMFEGVKMDADSLAKTGCTCNFEIVHVNLNNISSLMQWFFN